MRNISSHFFVNQSCSMKNFNIYAINIRILMLFKNLVILIQITLYPLLPSSRTRNYLYVTVILHYPGL
ncbi:Uncharacterised protein [Cedecea neteri]|uniref:Uncharacterized protein n=1 Tax=Cedecea neteri TaxID=158822 RepID=A0A2X3L0B3_9ENTR|nr:Uncharacterised protein [Cedecea neteri]